jgi:hypothetical protein
MTDFNLDHIVNEFIQLRLKWETEIFISALYKWEDEIFISALRVMAEPPIKGEITKGKIQWRGIRMIVQHNDGFKYTKWLEQRGKQISPKIIFDGIINNDLKY